MQSPETVKRFYLLILFYFLFAVTADAQTTADTIAIPRTDSLLQHYQNMGSDSNNPLVQAMDTVSKRPVAHQGLFLPSDSSFSSPAFNWEMLNGHPYFGFSASRSVMPTSTIRKFKGKEPLFYLLVFLVMVIALLRRAFSKYFNDFFRLFFRTTLKQSQIQEQLMQTPLPSILLNGFFVVSGGLYITFLLDYYQLNQIGNFWLMFFYCSLCLSIAYLVKFIGLKVSGWLFNMKEAADRYIFSVFIVNKMIGILLLPFLILLAFTTGDVYSISLSLSWCMLTGLLVYRVILTYDVVRNQVKVNLFHFFLYLCAFEIAPLLLVYKGLLLFFRITA